MKILFLGDIVGPSGCMVVEKYLKKIVEKNKIRDTGWTNEEAMKAVISLGIVTPEKIKK